MILVGVMGGGLAISHATQTDWLTRMSVSGLGMDSGASGILNTTLVALGLILLALAISLEATFAGLCSTARLSPRAHRLLSVGFAAAGGAVVVAGLFRNHGQPSHLIHSLASFAAPIVLVATILGCRLTVADLGRRFDRLSVAILIVSVGLFVAAYPAHLVPYALMELICFALIGAWIWLLEARLQDVIVQL
jgi:cytochrome bd-type quinol oxidase subunit 2